MSQYMLYTNTMYKSKLQVRRRKTKFYERDVPGMIMMMFMMIIDWWWWWRRKTNIVIERFTLLWFFCSHFINLNFVVLVVLFPFGSRLDDVWKFMYIITRVFWPLISRVLVHYNLRPMNHKSLSLLGMDNYSFSLLESLEDRKIQQWKVETLELRRGRGRPKFIGAYNN